MTDVTKRVSTKVLHEVIIPAREPFGATQADVQLALQWAEKDFERANGRAVSFDDDLMFFVGDEEIIVRFTTEGQLGRSSDHGSE